MHFSWQDILIIIGVIFVVYYIEIGIDRLVKNYERQNGEEDSQRAE